MTVSRIPAVAGLFYPNSSDELKQNLTDYLACASTASYTPKALVVPHAGYIYSGPVAASAYKTLDKGAAKIDRVVLFGPAHRVPVKGLAVPTADSFLTPLGEIELDQGSIMDLLALRLAQENDLAHQDEHSIEVQLPFLQSSLNNFKLVPVLVGQASVEEVSLAIKRLWGDERTLIVVSTDLSHYHSYRDAQVLDKLTTDAVVHLQPSRIHAANACGGTALRALLDVVREKGLAAEVLDLRNSGDTAGSKDRVVGYGAYAFH